MYALVKLSNVFIHKYVLLINFSELFLQAFHLRLKQVFFGIDVYPNNFI